MKTKHLLLTLLLALMVPLAALAQVERTVTDGPTSTVETNQTRAITDNNSPIHIRHANFVTTNSAWIVFDCDLEHDFYVSGQYSGQYYIRYKTESMSNWSEERSFNVEYNGRTPYCNFAYVCSITPYTRYTVQIRCFINNAYCEWSDEFSFATLCPATATPYNIDFNGLSALPQYWRVETGTGNACSVANDQLSVSTTSGNPLDAYVILPYFENLATLQLSFNAARTAGSCNEMQVGIMTDPFDANTFSPLQTLTLSEATTTYGSSLLEASTQHGHIAIKLNDATEEQHSVWFDDFAVTRLQALDNLAVNVTNSSATLSWTTIAPSVQIQYREADGTWSASITPEGNPYTITGLTESTNYEARICANFTTFYSDWVSFGTFKTLMQEAYTMGASANHTYTEDFETTDHRWILNNGASTNYWCRSWDAGIYAQINPHLSSNKSIYITDGTTTGSSLSQRPAWQYTKMNENQFQNIDRPSIVYLTKIFNLSAGQYTFNFDYKVMGKEGEDYLRVFLLPADIELEGTGNSSVFPNGYQNWYYLDNGTQVAQTPNNNTVGSEYVSFGEGSDLHNVVNVYEGGNIEPGNYMMVFAWRNIGSTRVNDAVQYPAAIDNVSVAWSPLVTPPDMTTLVAAPTDTQATLTWQAPTCTLTPTGYEVEYATDASFTDALTASTNTNSVTLTGLTANTNYYVQIRSTYTTNGTTIYSDWSDACAFTTGMPIPTELTLVSQTTSWANVMWTPVALTLPEGQSINYSYQLTTDVNDWGEANEGLGNESWAENLAPATYHFRVRTAIYDSNTNELVDFSAWSEPIQFTIAPWSEPVSVFPLTYSFDEWSSRFVDGITLDGNLAALEMANYNELLTPDGGENEYSLRFLSSLNSTACVVLPPLNPSTSDAMVSFWWYHHSGHENFPNTSTNDGVEVETSTDGINWTTASYGVVPRYDANFTGWKKYEFVFPATTNPTYLRLRFVGTTGNFLYCYLDDLTVRTFKSEQPYISYVGCDANTAIITLYDYAYQNGYHSSAFEVQYREWRDPSETQNEWVGYPIFENEAPYAFERTLTLNGLQPATCYEFRACACVSYGDIDYWSGYCEPYRQWTDCGTYTITPSYSYTEDFEELFNGTDCWTGDMSSTSWSFVEEGHLGGHCLFIDASGSNYQYARTIKSPMFSFSNNCNNVILRFWTKCTYEGTSTNNYYIRVYYKDGNQNKSNNLYMVPETNDWQLVELSLSKNALGTSVSDFQIGFYHNYGRCKWYIDDIEIVANAYDKVFDCGQIGVSGNWTNTSNWFPHEIPNINEDVMIMGNAMITAREVNVGSIQFGSYGNIELNYNQALSTNNGVGELNAASINLNPEWQTKAFVDVKSKAELNVSGLTAGIANSLRVSGTANIITLNPSAANSVVVNDGGVLYAGTITGTSDEVDNTVVVEDGGQLKLDNQAYVTVKKNIGSYTAIEAENNVERGGYYLISSPLNTNYFNPAMAGACTSDANGADVVWTYDLYKFDYEQVGEEWRNYKVQNFLMRNGRGYLYANRDGVDLSFAGPVAANNTQMPVNTNYGQGSLYPFNGWTLVGNPYPCNTYISGSASDMSFYRMNPSGSGFMAATGAIKPMEGIFVYTQMAGQAVYFNRDEPTEPGAKLGINLKKGNVLVDNAIIRFAEGGELPKFSFSDNTSKVYFPMKDKDYAVMHSQPVGELPLNFEAAEDGIYTLSFENATEGLVYCHLIDNKTGVETDLLQQPEYTFDASVKDYPSRFRVVFASLSGDADGDDETFAFNHNGNWIILNEGRATLQVVDLMGRILSSEQIEGSASKVIHAAPGVYMIRLVNGENVRVQKIVVR